VQTLWHCARKACSFYKFFSAASLLCFQEKSLVTTCNANKYEFLDVTSLTRFVDLFTFNV
jgi:hypothetical protein